MRKPGTPRRAIPFQPNPVACHVLYDESARSPDGIETTIARSWRPGDVARCRLCPPWSCSARDGLCMLKVHAYVPEESAPFYSWGASNPHRVVQPD